MDVTDDQRQDDVTDDAVRDDATEAGDDTQVIESQPDHEATQVIDAEATQVIKPEGDQQLYRTDAPEETRVLPEDQLRAEREREQAAARAEAERIAREQAEAERQAAEERRQRQEEARQRALGTVTPAEENTDVAPIVLPKRITDKFFGSLGLFLLRLVTAAIIGVHGYQKLTDHAATTAFFTQVGLPRAGLLAWGVGVAEVLAAIALIFGFLTRFAGAGIAAIAIAALSLVKWGAKNPFQPGQAGFIGEFELLLAAVGVLLMLLGGGGWGIDAGWRRGRQRRKAGLN